jgi:acylphosphatase
MPESLIRRQVIYHGRVQGVGFRYTVHSISRQFPVTGFVRNLPDGTVELMVDADDATFERFHAEIQRAFAANIRDAVISKVEADPPPEAFTRFEIRQ